MGEGGDCVSLSPGRQRVGVGVMQATVFSWGQAGGGSPWQVAGKGRAGLKQVGRQGNSPWHRQELANGQVGRQREGN